MCGIVGYNGDREAAEILMEGLGRLEYRGYDSAGIAVTDRNRVVTVKAAGRLKSLREQLQQQGSPHGHVGIGHTRWATHGEPTDVNAHPHTYGRVTLVHNGIIENERALRTALVAKGETFISDTDTEVIAHLIDACYRGDPIAAIVEATDALRGSYALGILFADRPDCLYALRKDSPLVVGVGDGECLIASDIPALLAYTTRYYLLEEGEIACLGREGVRLTDRDGRDITAEKPLLTADWDREAAEKGGYPHFMLKEIHEQPASLSRALFSRLSDGIEGLLREELPSTEGLRRLVIVACGSALNAGLLGKHMIEGLARISVEVCIASEFRYADPILGEGDAVLVISQSGETADSLAALRLAKARGIPVYALVNVVGSSIAREADHTIYLMAGPEIAVATTKAYTSQVALLALIALRLAWDRGRLSHAEAERRIAALKELPSLVEALLSEERIAQYRKEAAYNVGKHDFFLLGRGRDYAVGCEGAMKIKEVSYLHCEAYAAGELKHGTISLIETGVPCLAIATDPRLLEKTLSNVKEVKARGARVLLLCAEGMAVGQDACDAVIELPQAEELLMPLLAIVPIQVYAYETAVLRGCDVDQPRNLAKSVTVE